ncbi:MAG: hypothetical protein RLZZ43_1023 [Actinomycetota bacterium]|jgi:hypothetical protein
MSYVFCNGCGHRNPPQSSFCSSCGSILDGPDMRTVTIAKVDALQDAPGVEDNISVTVDQSGKKKALLVVRNGPNEGARFSLSANDSVIGRHPDSTICLDDVTVSRRHAHLEQSDGQVVLRDLGSLNGTYVNQERIEEVALRHGDEVQIGRYRMVFFESAS